MIGLICGRRFDCISLSAVLYILHFAQRSAPLKTNSYAKLYSFEREREWLVRERLTQSDLSEKSSHFISLHSNQIERKLEQKHWAMKRLLLLFALTARTQLHLHARQLTPLSSTFCHTNLKVKKLNLPQVRTNNLQSKLYSIQVAAFETGRPNTTERRDEPNCTVDERKSERVSTKKLMHKDEATVNKLWSTIHNT